MFSVCFCFMFFFLPYLDYGHYSQLPQFHPVLVLQLLCHVCFLVNYSQLQSLIHCLTQYIFPLVSFSSRQILAVSLLATFCHSCSAYSLCRSSQFQFSVFGLWCSRLAVLFLLRFFKKSSSVFPQTPGICVSALWILLHSILPPLTGKYLENSI